MSVVLASIKQLQKCTTSVCVLRTAYPRRGCWGMRENADVQNDVSLPPLPRAGTALLLLDVINNIPFILYPCAKSHHFRFLSCISRGTAQGTHPTPPHLWLSRSWLEACCVLSTTAHTGGEAGGLPPSTCHPLQLAAYCLLCITVHLQRRNLIVLPGLSVSSPSWDPSFHFS